MNDTPLDLRFASYIPDWVLEKLAACLDMSVHSDEKSPTERLLSLARGPWKDSLARKKTFTHCSPDTNLLAKAAPSYKEAPTNHIACTTSRPARVIISRGLEGPWTTTPPSSQEESLPLPECQQGHLGHLDFKLQLTVGGISLLPLASIRGSMLKQKI